MAAIQIVKFRLAAGNDLAAFRALNERFQREIAPILPGLQRREASVSPDGEWVLVLRYADVEHAKKAGQSDTSETAQSFMKMIDMSSMSASFTKIVSE